MATSETLTAIVGLQVDSDDVQALIATVHLIASSETDLEEGEPIRSHLSGKSAGYSIMHILGRVNAIFIYVIPKDGFKSFRGLLPGGLPKSAGRKMVRDRFGLPKKSGEPFTDSILGSFGSWDRFTVHNKSIHFQYSEPDESIELVTVMMADDVP